MVPPLFKKTSLLAALFPFSHAIKTYTWTPSNWTAGTTSSLTIINDLSSPNSMDAAFDNLTVFLSAFDVNIALWSFCHLSPSLPNSISPIPLTIPPAIAPEDNTLQFALGLKEFKKDHSAENYQYTYPFTVAGLTGGWSHYEILHGDITPHGLQDKMPCSAYPCARACISKYIPSDLARPSEDQKVAWDCIAACEGVEYPRWEVYTSSVFLQTPSLSPSLSTERFVTSAMTTPAPSTAFSALAVPTANSDSGSMLESADVFTAVVTSISITHVRASASGAGQPAKSEGSSLEIRKAVNSALCMVVTFVAAMTWWNLRSWFWDRF